MSLIVIDGWADVQLIRFVVHLCTIDLGVLAGIPLREEGVSCAASTSDVCSDGGHLKGARTDAVAWETTGVPVEWDVYHTHFTHVSPGSCEDSP